MSDIKLTWDVLAGAADVGIEANDLETDGGLETAVMLSTFTDRQAEPGDELPEGETDRRGWWADAHPVVDGDKFGSRLWLLDRAKQTQANVDRAREYELEALQWLLDDLVASKIEVVASIPRPMVWGLAITIHRPNKSPVHYRFNRTWESQAEG